jgi:hypothetical protein
MAEVDIDITGQQPKDLDYDTAQDSGVITTTNCRHTCPVCIVATKGPTSPITGNRHPSGSHYSTSHLASNLPYYLRRTRQMEGKGRLSRRLG